MCTQASERTRSMARKTTRRIGASNVLAILRRPSTCVLRTLSGATVLCHKLYTEECINTLKYLGFVRLVTSLSFTLNEAHTTHAIICCRLAVKRLKYINKEKEEAKSKTAFSFFLPVLPVLANAKKHGTPLKLF